MARQEVLGTADSAFTRFAPRPLVEPGLNSWGGVLPTENGPEIGILGLQRQE